MALPFQLQDLLYALTQSAHNFGAVAVTAAAIFARWPARQSPAIQRQLAWLVLAGWAVQAASGATLGAISLAFYGRFPDIHGIALAALLLKMACAATGLVLAAAYLKSAAGWPEQRQNAVWSLLVALAITALSAAAFLRWFS